MLQKNVIASSFLSAVVFLCKRKEGQLEICCVYRIK